MVNFPINAATFKKSFLGGNGSFEAVGDPEWGLLYAQNKPFHKEVDDLVRLKFSAGTSKDFTLGRAGDLALSVGVSGEAVAAIELIWPGDESEAIDAYDLGSSLVDGKLYVQAHFDASADASVSGTYPIGPLSTTFGIAAGGNVGYDRFVLWDANKGAKTILDELFANMRLPHAAADGSVLAEGEVLALQHGGYLKLSAGLSWGYSLSMSESFEIADLSLALDYGLKIMAAATLGYRIAGDFDIVARRGTRGADWVRFQVRKSRESQFDFAADFGFTATADLNGLPESADDFLAALLGTNAKTFLGYFARAKEFTSIEKLEEEAGALAVEFLGGLSQKWLGKALDNTTIKEFFAVAAKVVETYETIDSRILDLYEEYLDKIPKLEDALKRLAKLTDPSQIKGLPPAVLDLLRRVWGERFVDLLFGTQPLADLKAFVEKVQAFLADTVTEHVRDLIREAKQKLGLEKIFAAIKKLDTPAKLKALADAKLQEIVGKLIGRAFSELKTNKDFTEALAAINKTFQAIDDFKKKWYEHLTKLVHQKFTFDLHYAYSRATTRTTLIDVEVSVATPAGRALASAAAKGDFSGLLGLYDPDLVAINEATLTHQLSKSAEVQINVFGYSFQSLVQVVQNVVEAVEVEPGGLMHVYTIETYIKQRKKKQDRDKMNESVESNFLLAAVGKTFQPIGQVGPADPVVKTLTNMAVDYSLAQLDDVTTAAELTQILAFAEELGLVPSAAATADAINREFPDGLGKVSANYVVRYDNQAVRNAFTLSGDELAEVARATTRSLVAAKYTSMRTTQVNSRVGFAYLEPKYAEVAYTAGTNALLTTEIPFFLPSWFTKGPPKKIFSLDKDTQRPLLKTLFNVEKSYVKRLDALDTLVDDAAKAGVPVPLDALAKAALDFVSMADSLDTFGRVNTFFGVFDRLVREGSSGKGRRQTVLILEITPPGGEKVTKLLMG